ncbi:MAG: ATP-binding protein, partial [Phycisphaerae bacterium]
VIVVGNWLPGGVLTGGFTGALARGAAGVGGGKIRISLEKGDGARVALLIEDNGPGIPEKILESVFNPFFTTKHSGTGLGLAIVHRIIEAHGGQIFAENRVAPDRGARFRIVL